MPSSGSGHKTLGPGGSCNLSLYVTVSSVSLFWRCKHSRNVEMTMGYINLRVNGFLKKFWSSQEQLDALVYEKLATRP